MDLKDIKAIIDLMKKNSIAEFELEKEGFKIKLKRGSNGGTVNQFDEMSGGGMTQPSMLIQPQPAGLLAQTGAPPPSGPPSPPEQEIKSPMIGTFYRAPSPDSSPYVEVGTEVTPETVVCIIEAMKVMNEIKAETRGIITQACVDNTKPVEFGQPLFKVRPI